MKPMEQPADIERRAAHLKDTARMLGLAIESEQLVALAAQLCVIEALEGAELADAPPILRMDADWHD